MQKFNKEKSFTLIELLVVIAIIGLLASIIFISLSSARAKARDTKRKMELDEIRKAILLYANDHNGLPISGFGWSNGGNGWATNHDNGSNCYSYGDLEDFLDGTDPDVSSPKRLYIKMPHDPKVGGCGGKSGFGGYMYYHASNTCAVLYAHLEDPSQKDLLSCKNLCVGNPGYGMNYCVEVKY